MTITEFLLARIAEDEAVARAASHDGPRWRHPVDIWGPIVTIDDGTDFGEAIAYAEGRPTDDQGEHIARHDPARVLAECEAKRRIVEVARYAPEGAGGWGFRRTLRALASVHADHPDFDEAWRD